MVLVREETSPEDIEGIAVSEAVITSRGGMTSHAAVVARGMGICSVVGCERLDVLEENKATVGDKVIEEEPFYLLMEQVAISILVKYQWRK